MGVEHIMPWIFKLQHLQESKEGQSFEMTLPLATPPSGAQLPPVGIITSCISTLVLQAWSISLSLLLNTERDLDDGTSDVVNGEEQEEGRVCPRYLRNLLRVMLSSSSSPLRADTDTGGFRLTKHVCELSGIFEYSSHDTG
ncbi:hypothetical protein EYF80_011900 [Liparis tanakae]|uniref:Uncharacterized protein n=1 Tax=Liparis tanakae TaxID=230148 RepID=A0A4Z2IKY0_9TELE|nr:hypothetical protein EYF80_011900 [Liparis tanakae]